MGRFQVLLVVLLTGIALELGLIAVKLPTSAAHAAPIQAPGTAIEDPHDTLKRQIAEVQRELAGDRQRLVAIEQQIARVSQSVDKVTQNVAMVTANHEKLVSRVNDDSRRLLVTCFMGAWMFIKTVPGVGTQGANGYCTAQGWKRQSGPALGMDFDTPFGP